MTEKRLGSAEKEVLRKLHRAGGTWTEDDPALWENNAYWSRHLLLALVKKGFVDEVIPDKEYKLTPEGADGAAL